MRFSLLGYDNDVLELTRAALEAGHELSAVFEVEEHPADLPRALDDLPHQAWETLLLGTLAHFVIVSHGDHSERRADALRKLIQAGVPLIVVQPGCEAIVGFELEMIRNDTKSLVLPYAEELVHPRVLQLASLVDGELGRVEQVALERTLLDRSKAAVLRQLVRDTGLVRTLLGPIRKVSALGAGASAADRLANLSVHMTTASGTLVRWSVGPAAGEPRGTLTVSAEHGQAVLSMPRETSAWTISLSSGKTPTMNPTETPAQTAIKILEEELRDLAKAKAGWGIDVTPLEINGRVLEYFDWLAACRDVEVAETAERSLLKGKTLELYHEEHSEKATFMGMMAAGGCLLLSVTLLLFVVVAILGGASLSIGKSWPVLLLVVLGGFSLLQMLLLVFRGDARGTNASLASSNERSGKPGQA